MPSLYRRLKAILQRGKFERDLQDELTSHLEIDKQQRMELGEKAEEAARQARRDFGNLLRPSEEVREAWGIAAIDRLSQDLRYALRQMKRNPGFVMVAVLTLGLGIGANTAIFSIVNAILIRPLPYKNSDRLIRIVENVPAAESFTGLPQRSSGMSPDDFQEWRSRTKTLSAMALEMPAQMTFAGREAVRLSGEHVSPAMFSMLGIQPALGRVFEQVEEKPGSGDVVILSHATWQRVFGADPQILGRMLSLDDTLYRVVGVMPRGFAFPDPLTEFWIPLTLTPPKPGRFIKLRVTASLNEGVTLATAEAEANAIGRELRGEPATGSSQFGPPRIQIMTWKDELLASVRRPLIVFVIAVTFVLLVACVNVANLFLARGTTRSREIAVRLAIGAGRRRVLGQLMTENFILSFLGGGVGIALAYAGTKVFIAFGTSLARSDLTRFEAAGNIIPRLDEIAIDPAVLLFTAVLTIATGILFGLIPAIQIRRNQVTNTTAFRAAGAATLGFGSMRTVLVVGQVALTMILLLGAGLLIKSFVKLANTNLGYDPTNVLTFKVPQPSLEYPRDERKQIQQNAFAEELASRLASAPDIQAAGFTNGLPMVQAFFALLFKDGPRVSQARLAEGRMAIVSHDYFRAMGMRIVEGRGFSKDDRSRSRAVYVINKAGANAYFPDVNPIGKTVSGAGFNPGEIVGIVDDIRQSGLDADPEPQLFMDPEHMIAVYGGGFYFVVRTTKDAAAIVPIIRTIVRDIDPTRVVDSIATLDQILANSITTPRSYAVLLGAFAAAALVLAMIGLYGVLAYFVAQRTREFGIRLAVGAQRSALLLHVLKQGLAFAIEGVILGIAGGAAFTRYLEKMLFGVATLDTSTFAIVPAVFIAVALMASYIPARWATKVDPISVLRYE